jgi:lysophospholipase L1-like esterase
VTFVGTLVSPGPNPQRHNGHGGDTIAAVRAVVEATYGPGKAVPHADLVMLMVGTNDCTHPSYDPEATPHAYEELLDVIAAVDPATTLQVTTLQPLEEPVFDAHSHDLSDKLPMLWAHFRATHSNPLRTADLRARIGAWSPALYADGVHFNTAGYQVEAQAFESALSPSP